MSLAMKDLIESPSLLFVQTSQFTDDNLAMTGQEVSIRNAFRMNSTSPGDQLLLHIPFALARFQHGLKPNMECYANSFDSTSLKRSFE